MGDQYVGAFLRLLFHDISSSFQPCPLTPLEQFHVAWQKLYWGVMNSEEGGLEVIRQLQAKDDRIRELEEENARLMGLMPKLERLVVTNENEDEVV